MLKIDFPILRTKGEDHEETTRIGIGHDRRCMYIFSSIPAAVSV